MRAHDVVLAYVEVGHAVGVRVWREQEVVVRLARVGALGALFDLDQSGVDRSRLSRPPRPWRAASSVVRAATWQLARAKVVNLVAGAKKGRAQLVLAPGPEQLGVVARTVVVRTQSDDGLVEPRVASEVNPLFERRARRSGRGADR